LDYEGKGDVLTTPVKRIADRALTTD